jgi:beta-mannanase
LPYYPGDEYVDWVGLSLYYYALQEGDNSVPPPGYLSAWLTGGNGQAETDIALLNFYNRFAIERNKPMILSESGAPYNHFSTAGSSELTIKQTWWRELLGGTLQQNFPKLLGAVNFEERKADSGKIEKDWKIVTSTDQTVISSFVSELPSFSSIVYGNQLQFTCGGSLERKA